jgi:hypothetical protein
MSGNLDKKVDTGTKLMFRAIPEYILFRVK